MSNKVACHRLTGLIRAACGVYPLNGVTVGKTVAYWMSSSWVGKSRKETTSPSETGRQSCWLPSSMIKYWCGWTGDGCEMQRGGRYGSRGGVGIRARGGRQFSSAKDGRGGRGRECGSGEGETARGDGVRETGDLGVGERTWYDGEAERDGGPKVNSVGASSS